MPETGNIKDGLHPEKVAGIGFRTRVRLPSAPSNKHYNFDTIGIETVVLILLPKILVAQGFSAFFYFRKVSLCCRLHCFHGHPGALFVFR